MSSTEMVIRCPAWLPVLTDEDFGRGGCYLPLKRFARGWRFEAFRAVFSMAFWNVRKADTPAEQWRAAMQETGYTEDAAWCYV